MTEAALATAPTVPLTTVDNVFSIAHLFFDQLRMPIVLGTGTGTRSPSLMPKTADLNLVMVAWLYNKFWINRKFYPSMELMQGKTVLIISGHTGTGYETAKDLLRRGARVVITCHDMYEGRQAVRQLRAETECDVKNIHAMECDLCSLDSVRQFAKAYLNAEERLDVLICNANLMWSENVVTKDGFNSLVQVNYLSHFLLTNLLLHKLEQCRPSRIINVSSSAHRIVQTIDWRDALTQFKNHQVCGAYATSKVFQILSAYRLKRDLLSKGVNVFAVNPGWIWTSSRRSLIEAFGFYPFLLIYPILRLLKIAFTVRAKTGSRSTVYCAVEPALQQSTALYFNRCVADLPSWLCTHNEYADVLWKLSCEAVALDE